MEKKGDTVSEPTFIIAASSGPDSGGGGTRGFFAASSNIATISSLSSLLVLDTKVEGPAIN